MLKLTSSFLNVELSCEWFSEYISKVFVINLSRRPERWESIWYEFTEHAHIPSELIERVPAVDGSALNLKEMYRCGLISKLGWRRLCEPAEHHIWGMDLNPSAVGCACSHFIIWSKIVTLSAQLNLLKHLTRFKEREDENSCVKINQEQVYLVVEDDSVFPENFIVKLQQWMPHVPADWTLLYLSGLDTQKVCDQLIVHRMSDLVANCNEHCEECEKDDTFIARVPQLHRTTNAYLINAKGAARLLQLCRPLSYQLDTMMTLRTSHSDTCTTPKEDWTVIKSVNESNKVQKRTHENYHHHYGKSTVSFVVDPVCYTIQPTVVTQAEKFVSDIQR